MTRLWPLNGEKNGNQNLTPNTQESIYPKETTTVTVLNLMNYSNETNDLFGTNDFQNIFLPGRFNESHVDQLKRNNKVKLLEDKLFDDKEDSNIIEVILELKRCSQIGIATAKLKYKKIQFARKL